MPRLIARIRAYADAHDIGLVTAPEIVASGEACKNDPFAVANLQRRFFELRLDRPPSSS